MRYFQFLIGIALLASMLSYSCNTDDDNDDSSQLVHPDVTVNFTVAGDAQQTLNYTNPENSSGTDNISSMYDNDSGDLIVIGSGQGNYMFQIRAVSGPVPTTGSKTVTGGSYVINQGGTQTLSFNDLESGSLTITSASLIYETISGKFYNISGNFSMELSDDEDGTVQVSCTFTGLVMLTVPAG